MIETTFEITVSSNMQRTPKLLTGIQNRKVSIPKGPKWRQSRRHPRGQVDARNGHQIRHPEAAKKLLLDVVEEFCFGMEDLNTLINREIRENLQETELEQHFMSARIRDQIKRNGEDVRLTSDESVPCRNSEGLIS